MAVSACVCIIICHRLLLPRLHGDGERGTVKQRQHRSQKRPEAPPSAHTSKNNSGPWWFGNSTAHFCCINLEFLNFSVSVFFIHLLNLVICFKFYFIFTSCSFLNVFYPMNIIQQYKYLTSLIHNRAFLFKFS